MIRPIGSPFNLASKKRQRRSNSSVFSSVTTERGDSKMTVYCQPSIHVLYTFSMHRCCFSLANKYAIRILSFGNCREQPSDSVADSAL